MKLKVFYRGELVGTLADDPSHRERILFQYASIWLDRQLELSPFQLPLKDGVMVKSNPNPIFNHLFGVFYDSLPDAWGMSTLERFFRDIGKLPQDISPLAKLAYMGSRAMGALSYQPAMDVKEDPAVVEALDLAKLDREAHKIEVGSTGTILPQLAASSSAGGARPKVVVAMRESDNLTVYGAAHIPEGFTGWLVKLAALKRGAADEGQYGRIEYGYSLMAKVAGIAMPETKLLQVRINERNVGLFATRRFDRIPGVGEKQKRHVQTLAALQHLDFSQSANLSELLTTTWALTKDARQVAEAFRRVVFNVTACNFDDHVKNIAYLMDEQGNWTLAPGYDLTYSMGWKDFKAQHMILVNQSGRPTRDDLLAEAAAAAIPNAEDILEQVTDAVGDWPKYAKKAGVTAGRAKEIGRRIEAHGLAEAEKVKRRITPKGSILTVITEKGKIELPLKNCTVTATIINKENGLDIICSDPEERHRVVGKAFYVTNSELHPNLEEHVVLKYTSISERVESAKLNNRSITITLDAKT